jgi:hypothetical protein
MQEANQGTPQLMGEMAKMNEASALRQEERLIDVPSCAAGEQ